MEFILHCAYVVVTLLYLKKLASRISKLKNKFDYELKFPSYEVLLNAGLDV